MPVERINDRLKLLNLNGITRRAGFSSFGEGHATAIVACSKDAVATYAIGDFHCSR